MKKYTLLVLSVMVASVVAMAANVTNAINFCEGDTVTINGKSYTTTQNVTVKYKAVDGSDSTVLYILKAAPRYMFNTYASLANLQSYVWKHNNKTYTKAGVYTDSYQSQVYGCDSIYRLTLTGNPIVYKKSEATVSELKLPYIFEGQKLWVSGTYFAQGKTVGGQDSIMELNLSVVAAQRSTQQISICQGDSVRIGQQMVGQAGVYYDTIISGIQSQITEWSVDVLPTQIVERTVAISDQDGGFDWFGEIKTQSGVYDHYEKYSATEYTGEGFCYKAIYRLNLTVYPTYHFTEQATICQGSTYTWRGQTYANPGVYTKRYATVNGYDSIYQLTLTQNPVVMGSAKNVRICEGDFIMVGKQAVTESGLYYDTLQAVNVCDSIVPYQVNVNYVARSQESKRITNQETYLWHGQTLTQPGTYKDTIRYASSACDSVIYTLQLSVFPTYRYEDSIVICQGDSARLPWNGAYVKHAGWYNQYLKTVAGDDSVTALYVKVLPKTESFVSHILCQGETIYIGGQPITTAGVYSETLIGSTGCDSVVRHSVTIPAKTKYEELKYIAQGDSILWNGQVYKAEGDYEYIVDSVAQCPATYQVLKLRFCSDVTTQESARICQMDVPYIWNSKAYYTTGDYVANYKTVYGCDSILKLHLDVLPEPAKNILPTQALCSNGYILFGQDTIRQAGTYTRIVKTENGCDSVLELPVKERETSFIQKSVTLLLGSVYEWHYADQVESILVERDTILERSIAYPDGDCIQYVYRLVISVYQLQQATEQATICFGESYTWRGETYSNTGTYIRPIYNIYGQDSVRYTLKLTVLDKVTDTMLPIRTICQGQVIYFGSDTITSAGMYRATFKSVNGCDSVVILPVQEVETQYILQQVDIQQGEQIVWNNGVTDTIIQTAGLYEKRVMGDNGCIKEVRSLLVRVHSARLNSEAATICAGESYKWFGEYYSKAGEYNYVQKDIQGFDSVQNVLTLSVIPAEAPEILFKQISKGGYVVFGGDTLRQAGVYYDTVATALGCKKVRQLTLVERSAVVMDDGTQHIAQGGSYQWFDGSAMRTLTDAGAYENRVQYADGAGDSVVYQVKVVVHYLRQEIQKDTICAGASYTWYGNKYTNAGTYVHTAKDQAGFDSVAHQLQLEVRAQVPMTYLPTKTLCDGSGVYFAGKTITDAGVYYDTLKNQYGCDSVVQLKVEKIQVLETEDVRFISDTASLTWKGSVYSRPGTYEKVVRNNDGCITEVHRLLLNTYPTYSFQDSMATICAGDTLLWHGQKCYTSGTYVDANRDIYQHDSTYVLKLVVMSSTKSDPIYTTLQPGGSIMFGGQKITQAGEYIYRTTNMYGCDSISTLVVAMQTPRMVYDTIYLGERDTTVWYERELTISDAGNSKKVIRSEVTGLDSIIAYCTVIPMQSYRFDETRTICEGDSILWHGQVLKLNGVYIDLHHTVYGQDSTYRMTITLLPKNPIMSTAYDLCDGDSIFFSGRYIKTAGLYYDTISNIYGCDSIICWNIRILPVTHTYATRTINIGESFEWHGQTLTRDGEYTWEQKYPMSECVQTIEHLTLNVRRSYQVSELYNICQGDTLTWHGKQYSMPGTYNDVRKAQDGGDTTYTMTLNVRPVSKKEVHENICEGSYIQFGKRQITQAGIYTDTLVNPQGCDSIVTLIVSQIIPVRVSETHSIAKGESFVWRGDTLTQAGNYQKVVRSENGCDIAVYSLTLNVYTSYEFAEEATICQGEKYHWQGGDYSIADTYKKILRSQYGADSVYVLKLNVIPAVPVTTINESICVGTSIEFGGQQLTQAGTYVDTLKNSMGCDSIVKMIITTSQLITISDTVSLPTGTTYIWPRNNESYDKPGTYSFTTKGTTGCDERQYVLMLSYYNTYHFVQNAFSCYNEPYEWFGRSLTMSGTYYQKFTSVIGGHDSIYELHLTVGPEPMRLIVMDSLCYGETKLINGIEFNQVGEYYDTIQSLSGCDSMIIRHQAAYYPYQEIHESKQVAETELPFEWHGTMINRSGRFEWREQYVGRECDSVAYILDVDVYRTYIIKDKTTICKGDSVAWDGQMLHPTQSMVYTNRYLSVDGHDSICTMDVTVLEPVYQTKYVQLNAGSSYTLNGITYTESGVYEQVLPKSDGCDSIIKVIVRIQPMFTYENSHEMPYGDSYEWYGKILTEPGTYTYSKTDEQGDSVKYILHLNTYHNYSYNQQATICQGDSMEWQGSIIKEAGVFTKSYLTVDGHDSIYTITVSVLQPSPVTTITKSFCQGQNVRIIGQDVSENSILYDTLTNVEGCDSVIKYIINFHPLYYFQEQMTRCEGSELIWHGKLITHTGLYYDSLQTISGCDSIYELNVVFNKGYYEKETVQICASEAPYEYHGTKYYESGIYFDRYTTVNGCDSIYELQLTVSPTYKIEQTATICYGNYFDWKGRHLTESGIYVDSLKTSKGCDSVIVLTLTVTETYFYEQTARIKMGDSYSWHGREYKQPGTYEDRHLTVNGCDSVYRLILTVYYETIDHVESCSNQSIKIRDKWITTSGEYIDSLMAINGCDSIVKLMVTFHPCYHFYDTVSISDQQTYSWQGQEYSASGAYTAKYTSVQGCDSVYHLLLKVCPTYRFETNAAICRGEKYVWLCDKYAEAGTYTHMYSTKDGFDSLYVLNLTVNETYEIPMQINICNGESYSYKGRLFTEPGIYYDSMYAVCGCDSVYVISVNNLTPDTIRQTATVCANEGYSWRGTTYFGGGTFYKEEYYQDHPQCVSTVYELTLNNLPVYNFEKYALVCSDSIPYLWRDKEFWKDTIAADTMTNIYGCDSIYTLYLTVLGDRCSTVDSIPLCQGSGVEVKGKIYTEVGQYTLPMITDPEKSRPDSLYRFYLYPAKTKYSKDSVTICDSELPYDHSGIIHWEAGTYEDTLVSQEKCDSIVHFVLKVNPSYIFGLHYSICKGEQVRLRNMTITEPGIYYDSLLTINGCDSIYRYVVNEYERYYFEQTVYINEGSTYIWKHGDWERILTQTGTYYDSLRTVNGCDSIYCLKLVANPSYLMAEYDTICSTELPYWWHGKELMESGTYYDSLRTVTALDSVYRMQLIVRPAYLQTRTYELCGNDFYLLGNKKLTEPGVYYDTLVSSCKCDSVIEVIINRRQIPHVSKLISLCLGDSVNIGGVFYKQSGTVYDTLRTQAGCDSIIEYNVNVNQPYYFQTIRGINPGASYMFHKNGQPWELTTPGIYFDSCVSVSGCDSIYRIEICYNKPFYQQDSVVVCTSELPYVWYGHSDRSTQGDYTFYQPGVYYDSMYTSVGLDSVYKLTLNVLPSYVEDKQIWLDASEYYFRDKRVDNLTVVVDSFLTVNGCDSVIRYMVNRKEYCRKQADVYASICKGDYYMFGTDTPKRLTSEGIYRDSTQSVLGCDSITYLHLQVINVFDSVLKVNRCNAEESYIWRGQEYLYDGTYYDSIVATTGCDSVYSLVLNTIETKVYEDSIYRCYGSTYEWHGQTITHEGTYYDVLPAAMGCDSVIYKLRYHEYPNSTHDTTIYVCVDKLPFIWRNKVLWTDGQVEDHYTSINGCDSSYYLNLKVVEKCSKVETHEICQGSTFYVSGWEYTKEGYYEAPLPSQPQSSVLDSIYRFRLKFKSGAPFYSIDSVDWCAKEGESFEWRGRKYVNSGTYYDRYSTVDGCDSIYSLVLKAHPVIPITIVNINFCEGDTIQLGKQTISSSGIYMDTVMSQYGCDSVIKYVAQMRPTYYNSKSVVLCAGESYNFHGKVITTSGIYYDSLTTIYGCDSVYQLQITFNPISMKDTTILVCLDAVPYVWRGVRYYESATVVDTFNNVLGCDSVFTANIIVTDRFSDHTQYFCEGDTLHYLGSTIYETGEYNFPVYRRDGKKYVLDSVARVMFIKTQRYYFNDEMEACQGDTISYHGLRLTRSGDYQAAFNTIYGCDSIYNLHLTVHPTYAYKERQTIADYQSIIFEGEEYRGKDMQAENTIDVRYSTINGCDSIRTLYLSVITTTDSIIEYQICRGDSIRFRNLFGGQYLKETGVYADTILSYAVKKSHITTLFLTVLDTARTISAIADNTCADDAFVMIDHRYLKSSATPISYSIMFTEKAIKQGFADVYDEPYPADGNLIIPMPVKEGGFVRAGDYRLFIQVNNGVCAESQWYPVDFQINYPSSIMSQMWNNMVAVQTADFNGGYTFSEYVWYKNGMRIQGENKSYIVGVDKVNVNDTIMVVLKRKNETTEYASCPIVIKDMFEDEKPSAPIMVYPTQIQRNLSQVHIEAPQEGTYFLYSATGQLLGTGRFDNENQIVNLPPIVGCYTLRMQTDDGTLQTTKLVIY